VGCREHERAVTRQDPLARRAPAASRAAPPSFALHAIASLAARGVVISLCAAALACVAALAPGRLAAQEKTANEVSKLPAYERRLELDKLVKENPNSAEAHLLDGAWYFDEQRLQEALASFRKALALEPDNWKAVANTALTLEKLERYEDALATFSEYLTRKPGDARAVAYHAEVLWTMGKRVEAVNGYRKALAVDPHCVEAHFHLGVAFAESGIFREAVRQWNLIVNAAGADPDIVARAKENIRRAEERL
jgi:tetratricopeptide (TPR) repeat protein